MTKVTQLTPESLKLHLDDLERLAFKLHRQYMREMSKFKFKVKYFSPSSCAQLHGFMIFQHADEMAKHFKNPELSIRIYNYLIGLLERLRDGG